eukprot:gb/GECG01008219.1/.p1 GENE.gb/GECG01008219.1/~~gb/GECG01008219.1/.p1  ORF type:complete len:164 (+),score=26.62 gb/GECG01008219.1/:1-492(+)
MDCSFLSAAMRAKGGEICTRQLYSLTEVSDVPPSQELPSVMEEHEPFHVAFSRYLDRTLSVKRGKDSNQRTYNSVSSLWTSELGETPSEFKEAIQSWYKDGATYWERGDIGADIEGVLGGIGFVHPDDISESADLLQQIEKEIPGFSKRSAAGGENDIARDRA